MEKFKMVEVDIDEKSLVRDGITSVIGLVCPGGGYACVGIGCGATCLGGSCY